MSRRFTEEEVKSVIDQMEKNKAAGPNEMPIEFYQVCWDIIKHDLMAVFYDLYDQKIDLDRINYGAITFIPKGDEADIIKKFRPICFATSVVQNLHKNSHCHSYSCYGETFVSMSDCFCQRNIYN
jgi:hypothetical protein